VRGGNNVDWLYTKRSILQGTVAQDIRSLDDFDVIYTELSELLKSNATSWLFIQQMTHRHTLVLWANVQQNSRQHWLANYAMTATVADIVKRKRATLILHTPTDPAYLDWAKALGVKCIQTWLAFPFLGCKSTATKRHIPAIAGRQWKLSADRSEFDKLFKEAANSGIMVFEQADDCDVRLSKVSAACVLKLIPIMLKDDSTFWRAVTFGGKDCSIYAVAPIALDNEALILLVNVAGSNWTKFRHTWLQAWRSWAEKTREFWDEEILRERFKDEVGLLLPDSLVPIHHFPLIA